MMRAVLVLSATALFLSTACAPRVSKRAPGQPAPSSMARSKPQPAPAPEPAPVVVRPQPVEEVTFVRVSAPPEPIEEEAAAPPRPVQKTYYSYSDAQIGAMRSQSRDFKKLDDQLKACTRRSEASIARREEIPTDIARIRMSPGGLNAKKEKKIAKLKAEKQRLEAAHAEDMRTCSELEAQVTQLLRSTYDAEASLY